jgi:HSP20 family molecular chaperone IbpA
MSDKMVKTEQSSDLERVSDRRTVVPAVDVFESEEELLLVADLPGVRKKDLSIEVHDGTLSLEGRWSAEQGESSNLLSAEFVPADYVRRFSLPEGLDLEKIKADLTDGILRVQLPKAASLKPRQIPISTS